MPNAQTPHRRTALVIGNGNYHHKDIPALASPAYDAEIIANTLRSFGFEVVLRKNLLRSEMYNYIIDFGNSMAGSEVTLFYFAGHGIQFKNQNYLIPVNTTMETDGAVPGQSVDLQLVLQEIEKGKCGVNIVILDACHINPVGGKFNTGASRGLAAPKYLPKGTTLVYAAEPNSVSADGEGPYSLLATGLMIAFQGKDLSLEHVLKVTSAYVQRESHHEQSLYVADPMDIQKKFNFHIPFEASGSGPLENSFQIPAYGTPTESRRPPR